MLAMNYKPHTINYRYMIGIKNLRLYNVRSHEQADFQFVGDMNAIVGPNGSGKTTIIETLYMLLRGSSFKGAMSEITRYGSDEFKAVATLKTENTEHIRSLHYQQTEQVSLRKWMIDEKKYARLPLAARLPAVLFEPDIARLITGSPARRREYLDGLSGQLDLSVARIQNKYERTLEQRNQLLKQLRDSNRIAGDELFVWNAQLAQLADHIIQARINVVELLQKEISTQYKQLGGVDDIFLTYTSTVSDEPAQYASRLLQFLETSLQRDIALGHTTFGPHRDDLAVRLADQPATIRASRGEVRTVVIALKLLETKLLSQHYAQDNIKPILLLDDVLSELDLVHQEQVLAGLKDHQVFLTTTDAHALTPGVHTIALE